MNPTLATTRKLLLPLGLLVATLALTSSCHHFRRWRVPEEATPEVMYERAGCANCHGADRWGTDIGPGLREVSSYWTIERLAAYIASPGENRDARLEELDRRYENNMPGSDFLSEEQRLALAEWLLGYD